MQKDFRVCLVKASLLWSLAFLVLNGASCADEPKCEISCRLGDGPKDEVTVDPDSIIPSHCSIKNGGNISGNMTWKEVNDNITLKASLQCLVLKTANSDKRIYFASPLTVIRRGSPVFLYEKQMSRGVKCMFKGRPRPQITWYKHGSNLKTFNHTEEVKKLRDNGIFQVTTTLHVPGREEFLGIYNCFGNSSLSSGWSSSKEPKHGIHLLFRCSGMYIIRSGPQEIAANAYSNITLSCLVAKTVVALDDLRLTWNFKNQSDPLKTGGKYRIPVLEPISSCRRAFKLEIINVTADDEGAYSCHQSCKYGVTDYCKSSAQLELKMYSPPSKEYSYPTTRTLSNSTKTDDNTSTVQALSNSTKTDDNTSTVQVVKQSKPERWLTPVLIVSVGVFVLLTSVASFYYKKKRTHRGTERNLPMVESEMKACHEDDGEILL